MKHIKKTICFFVIYCFLSYGARAELFHAQSFYLRNGLQVVLIENHMAPVIKHMVWYKNGAADEKIGKGGTAHLLEHLMFRGTVVFPEERFDEIMEENGVNSNAFTSQDYTAYHQFADISKLEILMLLEADRMRNLYISDKNFLKERDIVYQERLQEIETKPMSIFMEKMHKKLWGGHPYSRPISGVAEEIKSLNKQDVLEYYNRFYSPENAVLVLAGDLNLQTAKELAEKYYGKLPISETSEIAPIYQIRNKTRQELVVYDSKVKNARLVYIFAVPSYNIDKRKALALEIVAEYLGAEKISPLYKALVEDEKIFTGIQANNGFSARGYDTFFIGGNLQENTPEFARYAAKKLQEKLNEIVLQVNHEDISAAKKRIVSDLLYIADSPENAAYTIGSLVVKGISVEDAEIYDEMIMEVSLKEVKSAMQDIIDNFPAVLGFLLPDNDNEEESYE